MRHVNARMLVGIFVFCFFVRRGEGEEVRRRVLVICSVVVDSLLTLFTRDF